MVTLTVALPLTLQLEVQAFFTPLQEKRESAANQTKRRKERVLMRTMLSPHEKQVCTSPLVGRARTAPLRM